MDTNQDYTTHRKALLTFNVFFREDTTTQQFLKSIIAKDPEHWAFFRSIFKGQERCTLTLVDRSIETPFQCMLAALFLKQLSLELGVYFDCPKLILTPVSKSKQHLTNTANAVFESSEERNAFLTKCMTEAFGKEASIINRRNPVFCRDLKIETTDYVLYIRCEGGIAYGWQLDETSTGKLSCQQLLMHQKRDLPCYNIFTHSFSRNGVFINVDLQPRQPVRAPCRVTL
jgi:hypothetical protein